MKLKTVWSVYFSATGTTRKVVDCLSAALARDLDTQRQAHCFNLPQARRSALRFGPEDLVVMGVPVYAGRVPNLLLPYLRDMVRGGGALAVPVVLYGNRDFDDALVELRNLAADNGFHPIAAGAFVGEHAFSRLLGAGRPDSRDMALAEELAERTAVKVNALSAAPSQAVAVAVAGHDPVRPYFTPRDRHGEPIKDFLKAKPVTDPARCVHCGLCAELCPMGAIDRDDVSLVRGTCIKCCACVKQCPTGAKYFDHEGFLFHQKELETQYAGHRAESKIFW